MVEPEATSEATAPPPKPRVMSTRTWTGPAGEKRMS
jgi:hypothetical protein